MKSEKLGPGLRAVAKLQLILMKIGIKTEMFDWEKGRHSHSDVRKMIIKQAKDYLKRIGREDESGSI